MEGINNYLKLGAIESYLKSVEREKYTPFTVDFLERWVYSNKEDKESLKEYMMLLSYEVDTILQIIRHDLKDFNFFIDIKKMLI